MIHNAFDFHFSWHLSVTGGQEYFNRPLDILLVETALAMKGDALSSVKVILTAKICDECQ